MESLGQIDRSSLKLATDFPRIGPLEVVLDLLGVRSLPPGPLVSHVIWIVKKSPALAPSGNLL